MTTSRSAQLAAARNMAADIAALTRPDVRHDNEAVCAKLRELKDAVQMLAELPEITQDERNVVTQFVNLRKHCRKAAPKPPPPPQRPPTRPSETTYRTTTYVRAKDGSLLDQWAVEKDGDPRICPVTSSTTFDDLVGMSDVADVLRGAVVNPLLFPKLYENKRTLLKGVILYGVAGTGKTTIAEATVNAISTKRKDVRPPMPSAVSAASAGAVSAAKKTGALAARAGAAVLDSSVGSMVAAAVPGATSIVGMAAEAASGTISAAAGGGAVGTLAGGLASAGTAAATTAGIAQLGAAALRAGADEVGKPSKAGDGDGDSEAEKVVATLQFTEGNDFTNTPAYLRACYPSATGTLPQTAADIPKLVLFVVPSSQIASKWVGEPERRLARVFNVARECAPAVVFFDEADNLFDDAVDNNAGTINSFKQSIGGFGTKDDSTITILATNYPERIEAAIRSRLPTLVEVPCPDARARRAIFLNECAKYGDSTLARYDDAPFRHVNGARGFFFGDDANKFTDIATYFAAVTRPPSYMAKLRTGPAGQSVWSGRDVANFVHACVGRWRSHVINTGFFSVKTGKTVAKWSDTPDLSLSDAELDVTKDPVRIRALVDEHRPEGRRLTAGEQTVAAAINAAVSLPPMPIAVVLSTFESFSPTTSDADVARMCDFNRESDITVTEADLRNPEFPHGMPADPDQRAALLAEYKRRYPGELPQNADTIVGVGKNRTVPVD